YFYPRPRAEMRRKLGLPMDRPIVAFTGHFHERKGPPRLLGAIRTRPEIGAVFLGSGPMTPKGAQVLFSGAVPHQEVPDWLGAADIFVLPTLAEGNCNAIMEAMACGLPVVASDSGEMPKVVGDAGLIVPEGDAQALARALAALAESPERRRRIGEAGRVRVCERYAQRPIAEATVAFYERVLSMRSATA
ncbi:MAG: glycosyltransferase, partial [Gemmatimonadetes bacterium]|nr:glycosyltransferase [Gemmatimonadota bacterium]